MAKLIERDNRSCLKFEVFFKVGSHIPLFSSCQISCCCTRLRGIAVRDFRHIGTRGGSQQKCILSPSSWLCFDHLSVTLCCWFYSERSVRNSSEDGAIAARLLPLTSFHGFCGSLLFISICNMFTSKMIMLGRDITSLTFHSSVQFS